MTELTDGTKRCDKCGSGALRVDNVHDITLRTCLTCGDTLGGGVVSICISYVTGSDGTISPNVEFTCDSKKE